MNRAVIIYAVTATVISIIIAVLLLALLVQRRRQRAMLLMAIAQEEAARRRRKAKKAGLRRRQINRVCPELLVSALSSTAQSIVVHSFELHREHYLTAVHTLRENGHITDVLIVPPPTTSSNPTVITAVPTTTVTTPLPISTTLSPTALPTNDNHNINTTTKDDNGDGDDDDDDNNNNNNIHNNNLNNNNDNTIVNNPSTNHNHHQSTPTTILPSSQTSPRRSTPSLRSVVPVAVPAAVPASANDATPTRTRSSTRPSLSTRAPTSTSSIPGVIKPLPLRVMILPTTQSVCVICLDTISIAQRVRALPCSHVYHSTCIRLWLRRKNSCPCCAERVVKRRPRTELNSTPVAQLDDDDDEESIDEMDRHNIHDGTSRDHGIGLQSGVHSIDEGTSMTSTLSRGARPDRQDGNVTTRKPLGLRRVGRNIAGAVMVEFNSSADESDGPTSGGGGGSSGGGSLLGTTSGSSRRVSDASSGMLSDYGEPSATELLMQLRMILQADCTGMSTASTDGESEIALPELRHMQCFRIPECRSDVTVEENGEIGASPSVSNVSMPNFPALYHMLQTDGEHEEDEEISPSPSVASSLRVDV